MPIQAIEASHSANVPKQGEDNGDSVPDDDDDIAMECECVDKLRSFFQNILFILLVIPVTLIVLLDIIGSLITCCCFCRGEKKFATKTLYLSFNLGCCSALFLRFLRRTSKEAPSKHDEESPPIIDGSRST